jgi:hypothetical protein
MMIEYNTQKNIIPVDNKDIIKTKLTEFLDDYATTVNGNNVIISNESDIINF